MFIGTTNPGKIAEIASMLSPLGIELTPVSLDVPETTDTFEGNAREKALAYAAHTGGITIAEDSGLIVPALNGLPGPWSARFSDWSADLENKCDDRDRVAVTRPASRSREDIDRANNALVLEMLRDVEQPRRAALFKVVLVVAEPGEVLFQATGECHGWIAPEARGTDGFGYDPIFVGQDTFERTFAELDPVRKNLRSHRKRVLDELFVWASQNRGLL